MNERALAYEHGVRDGAAGTVPEHNPYEPPPIQHFVGQAIDTEEVRDSLPVGATLVWIENSNRRYTVREQNGEKWLSHLHPLRDTSLEILEVESLPSPPF